MFPTNIFQVLLRFILAKKETEEKILNLDKKQKNSMTYGYIFSSF